MTTPTGGALNTDFELMGSVAGTIDAPLPVPPVF